jgi:hypothetical protein
MRFNTLIFALTALFFVACKGKSDTASSTTNTTSPAPPKEVPLPASLSKFKPLALPFKLEKGLAAGDLDQLGWALGTKMYFKTQEQVYATLACTSVADDNISFELQAYTPDGQPVGKAEYIQYFGGGASAEFVQSVSCALSLQDNLLICDCENYISGTNEDGTEMEETTNSSTKLRITAKGLETIIPK